jgi:hypothetical protein
MYEIKRAQERLNWEMEKDQEIIKHHKQKMIEEIKSYDRSKMVSPKPQKKLSFFKKILIVLGHGKKG